jgi:hypothetical protein
MSCATLFITPPLSFIEPIRRAALWPLSDRACRALGEPVIDRSEKVASLIPLALIAPEPRHAHRGAQLPGLCLLLTGDGESTFEVPSAFHLQLPLRCGRRKVLNLHPTVGPARAMEQTCSYFIRSQTSVLMLCLPLIGLTIVGDLIVSRLSLISIKRC